MLVVIDNRSAGFRCAAFPRDSQPRSRVDLGVPEEFENLHESPSLAIWFEAIHWIVSSMDSMLWRLLAIVLKFRRAEETFGQFIEFLDRDF